MKIARMGVSLLLFILCTHPFLNGQEDMYCIHIQYNVGLEAHVIQNALAAELENALFKTEQYHPSSQDFPPILNVEIGLRSKAIVSNYETMGTEYSALSIAYVFFPQSIRYYAYSNCYLVKKDTEMGFIAKAIDTELSGVYDLYYYKALDLNNAYRKCVKDVKKEQ